MRYHKTPKRMSKSLRKPSVGRSCVRLEVSHCWAGLRGLASSGTEADKCACELGIQDLPGAVGVPGRGAGYRNIRFVIIPYTF